MVRVNIKVVDLVLAVVVVSAVVVTIRSLIVVRQLRHDVYATNQRLNSLETMEVGESLPDVHVMAIDSSSVRSIRNGGEQFIVCFGLCTGCVRELPVWDRLHYEVERRGLPIEIIGLFVDDAEKYAAFSDRVALTMPVYRCLSSASEDTLRIRRVTQVYYAMNDTIRGVYFSPLSKEGSDSDRRVLSEILGMDISKYD